MSKIADNPYPGSRAFTQADQAFFFARDPDIDVVTDLWLTSRLTVLTGPVGSGKTSLLHAGVYPSLPVKRSRVLPVGNLLHGAAFPFPALGGHNPFTLALLRSWAPEDVPTRLAGLSVSDFVDRFAQGEDGSAYAAIDQLEDLLLGPVHNSWATWRERFLAELIQAMEDHPRLHLLLVTRDQALNRLTRALGGGARHTITALTTQAAVEAVTRPAVVAGRSFTGEAADDLVDNLRTPAGDRVEPTLLQVVCRRLWEQLPPGLSEISGWDVAEFGPADTALAAYCGQVIADVAALHDIRSQDLRSWLVNNFVTGGGTRGGAYEEARTTAEQPDAVPRDLLDRHLLTSGIGESGRCYRLLTPRLAKPVRAEGEGPPAPPTAAGYLRAAELELARGELELARIHAELARDLLPDSSLRDGSRLRERAMVESVLGNTAYRRSPLGDAEHRRRQLRAALRYYRKAAELLQAAGDTHAAAYQLAAAGQTLLAGDEPGDALPELRAAVDRDPNDLGLQIRLALALWQLGDGQGARAILDWVLTIDGGHAEALRARGEILADRGAGR